LVPGQLPTLTAAGNYGGKCYIPFDVWCLSSVHRALDLADIRVSDWTLGVGSFCQITYILSIGYGHDRRGKLDMVNSGHTKLCKTLPEQCHGKEGNMTLIGDADHNITINDKVLSLKTAGSHHRHLLFSSYDVKRSFIWSYYRLGARAGELHPSAFDKAIASNLSQMLPY